MKQTAVEWLIEQLYSYPIDEVVLSKFEQAKEMEQEQIKDAHYEGRVKGFDEGCKYTAIN